MQSGVKPQTRLLRLRKRKSTFSSVGRSLHLILISLSTYRKFNYSCRLLNFEASGIQSGLLPSSCSNVDCHLPNKALGNFFFVSLPYDDEFPTDRARSVSFDPDAESRCFQCFKTTGGDATQFRPVFLVHRSTSSLIEAVEQVLQIVDDPEDGDATDDDSMQE